MAQQTAVEWLIEQLVELDKQLDSKRKSDDSMVIKINPTKIYEQAKQMENEQLKEKYLNGIQNYDPTFKRKSQWTNDQAEQYYNETYNKE